MKNGLACSVLLLGLTAGGTALAQTKASAPELAKDAAKAAGKGRVALLCQAQNRSRHLLIDYGKKTVNGLKATIGEASITWTSEELDPLRLQRRVIRHELDRFEGSYRTWPEAETDAEAAVRWGCEKAPPPRF